MIRLAILGSTRGTNLDAIVEAISQHQLAASIEIVISNKSTAYILERARSYGLTTEFVDPDGLTREGYDLKISDLLLQYHVDLIVLIGYMRILSPAFISRWENKIINVHPSLLPAHAGKMDMDVHKAVIADGDKETGCSVHYVTEEVDAGPVIIQKKCPVLTLDSPQNLKDRVQKLEGAALVEAIAKVSL
jgi:phosphoribosylglycinamide formyltransferase-1